MDKSFILNEAWSYLNAESWELDDFSLKKAYVCSLFSHLAYLHVPQYEIEASRRVSVIPCAAYQAIVHSGVQFDVVALLRSRDLTNSFIIETPYIVVVGVVTPTVVIVAIRGTQVLYDWAYNLDVRHSTPRGCSDLRVHRGFYRALLSCAQPLAQALAARRPDGNPPLCVTGHSLGGAVAALLYTLWNSPLHAFPGPIRHYPPLYVSTAYTYGAPRYGDLVTVSVRSAINVHNRHDIVPRVPPRWMGYEDSLRAFTVQGKPLGSPNTGGFVTSLGWLWSLLTGAGIRTHYIEAYNNAIRTYLV